jgi:hypothetical protein
MVAPKHLHGNVVRLGFELIGLTRAATHPPTPRRPDQKSLQAEATTYRSPGTVDCPGFFFVTLIALFSRLADFTEVCVSRATLLEYFLLNRGR